MTTLPVASHGPAAIGPVHTAVRTAQADVESSQQAISESGPRRADSVERTEAEQIERTKTGQIERTKTEQGERTNTEQGERTKIERAESPAVAELVESAKELTGQMVAAGKSLQFSVEDDSSNTVIRIIDTETKQVIKQIPAQELVDIAKALREVHAREDEITLAPAESEKDLQEPGAHGSVLINVKA